MMEKKFRRLDVKTFQPKKQTGFSLVEVLVVVVIIGVIAAIAIARYQSAVKASNESSAFAGLKLILGAETSYRSSHASYGTIDDLLAGNLIDEAFADSDGDANTGDRSGYIFKITTLGSDGVVISAIPQSTGINGSGSNRLGVNASGVFYRDENNLSTHYANEADLTSGTSVPYDSH